MQSVNDSKDIRLVVTGPSNDENERFLASRSKSGTGFLRVIAALLARKKPKSGAKRSILTAEGSPRNKSDRKRAKMLTLRNLNTLIAGWKKGYRPFGKNWFYRLDLKRVLVSYII